MGALVNFFIDSTQEVFLHPARFIRKIKNHPPLNLALKMPPQTAHANQIIHWDKWDGCYFDKKYILNLMKRYESIQQGLVCT